MIRDDDVVIVDDACLLPLKTQMSLCLNILLADQSFSLTLLVRFLLLLFLLITVINTTHTTLTLTTLTILTPQTSPYKGIKMYL